jgi:lysophospholipase L1-like esterase
MIPSVLSEFDAKNIAMVTIFLGANDSNLPANKQQHVQVNEFKQNLVEIVEKIQVHVVLSLLNTGNDNDRHSK